MTDFIQIDLLDSLQPNQVIKVKFPEEGVGGELLNILSKGLYTNPLDAIREYVQNSIDANADQVKIQITGNSVWILDHGDGMTGKELLEARDFGVSSKYIEENVGFRGIGIYSGFDLCERLVIRTKTKSDRNEHILRFYFGDMRRKLDSARQSSDRPVIPLSSLLEEYTDYSFEPSSRREKTFTLVQLEELSENHLHRLSDVDEMKKYILRTLPIRFNEEFNYAEVIEKALRKNVPGYKSAKVILQIENSPQVTVEKPNIPDLEPPRKDFIYDSKGNFLAYYWACLTSISEKISARGFADFAGLVYKIKGFTIGNQNNLRHHFTRPQIYEWWTGEIYVVDPEIVPTSARDDFEAGSAKDALEVAVGELINGAKNKQSIQKIALEEQVTRRADQIVNKCRTKIEEIQNKVNAGEFDKFSTYSEIKSILDELKSQKNKATDKPQAKKLYKDAERLQKITIKRLEQPTSLSDQKRQALKAAMKEGAAIQEKQLIDDQKIEIESTAEEGSQATSKHEPKPEVSFTKNILQIIEASGWPMDEDCRKLVSLLADAIADNLGTNTKIYLQLLLDIEERLMDLSSTD